MWKLNLIGQLTCCSSQHKSQSIKYNNLRFICSSRRRFLCIDGNKCSNISIRANMMFMKNSKILWDYLRIDNTLKQSDLIFILGNSDLRTADYAAELFHKGLAPLVAVSGKEGHGTKGKWPAPEAVIFAQRLEKNNVPTNQIVMEMEATNTGENIRLTQKALLSLPIPIQPLSVILVQTPFMGRRTYATFMKQWDQAEQIDVRVTSPPIPMAEYANEEIGLRNIDEVVIEMIRTMHRILNYPALGFQIPQHVPPCVMKAYNSLKLHFAARENDS